MELRDLNELTIVEEVNQAITNELGQTPAEVKTFVSKGNSRGLKMHIVHSWGKACFYAAKKAANQGSMGLMLDLTKDSRPKMLQVPRFWSHLTVTTVRY